MMPLSTVEKDDFKELITVLDSGTSSLAESASQNMLPQLDVECTRKLDINLEFITIGECNVNPLFA